MARKQLTHCKHGHEWVPENIRIDSRGKKSCIPCRINRDQVVNEKRRAAKGPKTHCRHGHEWVPENIYILPSTGEQKCLLCKKESARKTAEKKRKPPKMKTLRTRCKEGHELTEENTFINVSNGGRGCRICRYEYQKEYNAQPGMVEQRQQWRAKWREENPDYHFEYALMREYKLTPEAYQELWNKQNGLCAICLKELSIPAHIDHDHSCCPQAKGTCGKCIRGILCPLCNQGLGQFKDDEISVRRAANYLKVYREKHPLHDDWISDLETASATI